MLNISAITEHWFWLIIIVAVIVWYSTITVYVTVKGAKDIKSMFARLKAADKKDER